MTRRDRKKQSVPWGQATGLLAACLATLIGVGSGLEPDVVLLRAATAGVVVGLLGTAITLAWEFCLTSQPARRGPSPKRAAPSRSAGVAKAPGSQNFTRTRKAE